MGLAESLMRAGLRGLDPIWPILSGRFTFERRPIDYSLDRTDAFKGFLGTVAGRAARIAALVQAVDDTEILVVPAFLGGWRWPGMQGRSAASLAGQVAWLQKAGVSIRMANVNSAASVTTNAVAIAREIEDARRKVLLLGFSKGGIDCLAALLGLPENRRSRVALLVTVQTPFFGSPVADLVGNNLLLARASEIAPRLVAGEGRAIADLATKERQAFLAERSAEVAALREEIGVLNLASRVVPGTGRSPFARSPATRWMADLGLANDGLVPESYAILPDAPFIVVPDLGHSELHFASLADGEPEDSIGALASLVAFALGTAERLSGACHDSDIRLSGIGREQGSGRIG